MFQEKIESDSNDDSVLESIDALKFFEKLDDEMHFSPIQSNKELLSDVESIFDEL